MLEEPYVRELAERFGARLRERRTNGALPAHGEAATGPGGRRGATGVSP